MKETLEKMYWGENKSQRVIAKELGISQQLVSEQMKQLGIPRRSLREATEVGIRKGRVKLPPPPSNIIEPNLSISRELAYITGAILGDGYVYHRRSAHQKIVILDVKDEEFAREFYRCLKVIGLNPWISYIKRRGVNTFGSTAVSTRFYEWFKRLTKDEIRGMALEYPRDFLRGLFDSEGTLYCSWDGQRFIGRAIFDNSDPCLVGLWKDAAEKLGFSFRTQDWNGKKTKMYRASLNPSRDVEKFLKEINPSIPRKSLNQYERVRMMGP